ncbi:uncharacterized protein RSE6_05217 [Rhynchosporium secalis]|uniref:Uncharacterized protein n=1 Tax=Rhynchosporium secalis TaxID=38038 RepID=A0A1E1M8E9_RHYSE|nr:uncharacterized protein RSE6_05217 [Rhynchosporium secalis]
MSSTGTSTITIEAYNNAKAIVAAKDKADGPFSLSTKGKSIFTRVSVLCAEPGCEAFATGHEVVSLHDKLTYDGVGSTIKNVFRKIQDGDAKVRANLRHCLWSPQDHKIDSIKVNWNGAHNNGWTDNSETVLTTENYKEVLAMMADRAAVDTMTVTISPKI